MVPDDELLRRYAVEGSNEAFSELVQRYANFVYGAALRMTRNTHRAEEVTQSVFVVLARKAKALLGRRELAGWLHVTARYAAADLARSEARRQRREREAETITEPDQSVDWETLSPLLDEELAHIRPRDREALMQRFFRNLSYNDVGGCLGISENAARMRVERALGKLQKRLSRRGIVSTAVAIEAAFACQPAVALPAAFAKGLPQAALGAAAGSGSFLSGLFLVMSPTKTAVVAAALVCAAFLNVALKREIASDRLVLVQAQSSLQTLPKQIDREEARARSALGPRLVSSNAGRASPAIIAAPTDWTPLVKNPAFEEALLASYRTAIPLRYAALFKERGFSPEQVTRCERATLQLAQDNIDVVLGAASVGVSSDDPLVRQMCEANANSMLSEIKDLVSPDEMAAYNRTSTGRMVSAHLANALQTSATPVSSEQSDALAQLVAAHLSDSGVVDWDSVNTNAGTVLSPPQMAMFRSVQNGLQTEARLEQTRMKSALEGPKSPQP
jgi:RNA polymerase sigma factor (sigma-70 family)